ncbi:MAG: hypothetical protein PVI92_16655 [Chromatiales bacterium]|jgi:hypothetical protein
MKRQWIWIVLPLTIVSLAGIGLVQADRDASDDDVERGFFSRWLMPQRMAYESGDAQLYEEECGSCHFPFQAGFLPAASWRELMQGLQDHFGENAELSDEDTQRISQFLFAHSADRVKGEIPHKVIYSLRYTPNPKRITDTAFFRHEHREIPPAMLGQQEREISFSNCDSCHTRALQGSYNEHEIRIPGVGRWDD